VADRLEFEGREVAVEPGDTVASALYRAGVRIFSRSFKYHRPRGLYCLTGDCPSCLVTVDGEPAVRACVTPAEGVARVARGNGRPSADHDLLSLLWRLRFLFPVGFYYKALVRPRWAWPRVEPRVRRLAGIGPAPTDLAPAEREARHHHPDLLVAGGGVAGLAAALAAAEAGRTVTLADEGGIGEKVPPGPTRVRIDALAESLRGRAGVSVLERAPVVGIYEGPLAVAAGEDFLHIVHPARVVVATGAVERHGVFPGSDLPGVWLARGAARLAGAHRLRLGGRVVYVGEPGESLDVIRASRAQVAVVQGEVVEARGRKRLKAVVVESDGSRKTIPCDALALSLGLEPRDGLLRMAAGLPVVGAGDVVAPGCSFEEAEAAGRAAALADVSREDTSQGLTPGRVLARPARGGFVCLCEDIEARDLEAAWEEGFRSAELLKRYTTATMGPCQGALCGTHLRSFVHSRVGDGAAAGSTTARPPARPLRLEDAAAGARHPIEQRTALHERHLEMGALMEWAGAWKRPERYGDVLAEYWAVRRDVSVMDVSTLGKFLVAGPDAAAFLERLYPCHVRDLAEGRIRYALVLNEAGHVVDDGTICALGGGRYYITFTSGGAEHAEAWLRDWAETWGNDVRLLNETHARGAINVTGPKARELVARLSDDHVTNEAFPYLRHASITVAGVPCLALRLGFTGELGFELHHPRSESVRLWDSLVEAGRDLDLVPHGLEALRLLRLEKGHILVGQDTDFDSTPAKLGMAWAVKMDKPDFVGRRALERVSGIPPSQRLAGLRFDAEAAPPEGTPLSAGGRHAGHLTSSRFSPVLGYAVALAWLRAHEGEIPASVTAGGLVGQVVPTPFYDPIGAKLRA